MILASQRSDVIVWLENGKLTTNARRLVVNDPATRPGWYSIMW